MGGFITMNRDYMANMYFNIVDVIETLEREPINVIETLVDSIN